jgi:hypothetical protein
MSPRLFVLTVATFALTPEGGSEEPTKQDYVAAVNQQCARIAQQTLDLANEHFGDLEGPPPDRQIQAYTEEAVVMQRDGSSACETELPPRGTRAGWTASTRRGHPHSTRPPTTSRGPRRAGTPTDSGNSQPTTTSRSAPRCELFALSLPRAERKREHLTVLSQAPFGCHTVFISMKAVTS